MFSDAVSDVKQVRVSNDGVWDTMSWETASATRNWTLTSGAGLKPVYVQIMDNAGLNASYSASITLDTTKPSLSLDQIQGAAAGSPITFAPSACTDIVGISDGTWDFGDGTTANGTKATHTYSTAGTYTATLTVQDFAGNLATAYVTVQNKVDDAVPEFSTILLLTFLIASSLIAVVINRKAFGITKKSSDSQAR
jgi:hypothetical protein